MRKEYDFSKGERGKFFGKVDTKNPIVEFDDKIQMVENSSETDSLPDKLPLASASGQDDFESASAK